MKNLELIINAQISAYEEGDLYKFLSFYSKDVKVFKNRELLFESFDQFKKYYQNSFQENPGHKVTIHKRIVLNDKVADYEQVTCRNDGIDLKALVIYKLINGKITEVDLFI